MSKLFVWFTRVASVVVIVLSFLVLFGWSSKSVFLTGFKEIFVPMAPNTAVCFILLSVVCLLFSFNVSRFVFSLTVVSFSLAFIRFLEMLGVIGDFVSRFFLFPAFYDPFDFLVGYMSFPTSIAFMCLSASLFLLLYRHRFVFCDLLIGGLSMISFSLGSLFLLGYLYSNPLLYGGATIPMAANTALAFMLLSSAVIVWFVGSEIDDKRRSAEQLENGKKLFISMISHELRTPLTPIRAHLELLLSHKVDDKTRRKSLETVLKNAVRLNVLINDLLDTTRIQGGRLQIFKRSAKLGEVIDQALLIVAPFAKDRNIKLSKSVGRLPVLNFDKDRILQVLINLLNNAIKHSESKDIKLSAVAKKGVVRVSVEDHGKGISVEDKAKLFNPFAVSKESAASKGAGLGLFISKAIVEQHGGKIGLDSVVGRGSTFYFTLGGKYEKNSDS